MFSVTYTGMKSLPLWTWKVSPDQLGRDHRAPRPGLDDLLRAGLHGLDRPSAADSDVDEGPLLEPSDVSSHERAIYFFPRRFTMYLLGCLLLGPGLVPLRGLAPRRTRVPAARALALAAAHGVVDRVHRDAAHVRALALPARAAGLADAHVLVLEVADLADRRLAHLMWTMRISPLTACAAWRTCPRAPSAGRRPRPPAPSGHPCLPSARRVDDRTERDVRERHRVAGADLGFPGPTASRSPDPHAEPAPGCSASRRRRSAAARCCADRFGSYSIAPPSPARRACRDGSRSSGSRGACGRRRGASDVTRPLALRPPALVDAARRAATSRALRAVISAKSETLIPAAPGRGGLVVLRPAWSLDSLEELDRLALGQL